MEFIDTHAHLNTLKSTKEFDGEIPFDTYEHEIPEVIDRAKAAGLTAIINPGATIEDSQVGIDQASEYEFLYPAVAVHPHATHLPDLDSSMAALDAMIRNSGRVVALGETGLDNSTTDYNVYFSEQSDWKHTQREFFIGHLELAKKHNLPVIIHGRDAYKEIFDIISDPAYAKIPTVLHCYTADFATAEPFLKHGSLISITGIATYPNAEDLRQTIAQIPLDHLMIETDSPFLAPQFIRGQRNEPAHVVEVAKQIATTKNLDLSEVAQATTANARKFFNLPS